MAEPDNKKCEDCEQHALEVQVHFAVLFLFQFVANFSEQLLGRRRFGRSLLLGLRFAQNLVDSLNHQENTEGYDQEVDERLDEVAVVDCGRLHLYAFGNLFGREGDFKVGKVHTSNEPSYWRHDDIVDKR